MYVHATLARIERRFYFKIYLGGYGDDKPIDSGKLYLNTKQKYALITFPGTELSNNSPYS